MITLGIDLGGTNFAAGCVDEKGTISHREEAPTQAHDAPAILLRRIADVAQKVRRQQPESAPPQALGIGVPGPVKHREGVCVYAPNLAGWTNLPVAAPLRAQLDLPVFVLNDANAATLAEARFGAGRGASSMLMLTLGTGIGSGLTIKDQLHMGATERGIEIGHTTIDLDDNRGSAGNSGTLESICGRDAIIWRALRHLASGCHSILPKICDDDLSQLTPHHIAQAAQQGDELSRQVWRETAHYLAAGLVNVIFITDVERVVIGGGIAQAGEFLWEPLRRAVAARTSRLTFDVEQIVPAQLGPDAGLIGAAQWAREQLKV